jgi:hypothetical protein
MDSLAIAADMRAAREREQRQAKQRASKAPSKERSATLSFSDLLPIAACMSPSLTR